MTTTFYNRFERHADLYPPPISHVRRQGGVLPSQEEIVGHVLGLEGGL